VSDPASIGDALDARLIRVLQPLEAPPSLPLQPPEPLRELIPPGVVLRPAAVLVGLVDRGSGSQVILTRRHEGLNHHPGQVAFPGGRQDPADPSLLHTALREAQEEIALALAHVRPLGFTDPMPTLTGFVVLPVVARIDPAHASRPDPREVAAVFEVPLDFLMDEGNARREELRIGGRRRQIWSFEFGGERIWGATAAMLVDLGRRLGSGWP
jgi:8-oxo-dGTP pyrophosphatase MutT (NUDIX family)